MFALTALMAMTTFTAPTPILAGYFPAWRSENFDFSRLAPLTHVYYFSVQPDAEGKFDTKDISMSDLPKLSAAKQKYGFKLLLCIGGWERGKYFMPTASEPAKLKNFVDECVSFCDKNGFDGIDLDWEHPKTPEEVGAYGVMIQALRKALAPKGRLVTAAIASWQKMSPEAVSGLSYVNLMSYDHPEKHATMEKSVTDVNNLKAMGFPASKIILGVPFYGRSLKNWQQAKPYSEILSDHKPTPATDETADFYYNGPKTLQAKAAYAKKEGLAGIMIWEVAHDATGSDSLIAILKAALSK